jgi:glycosyltransferase involved in cell wall biosynthesis
MTPTLAGNVCIRNGNRLDFCWRESIGSLLPVCDAVVVSDGESDDGTQEEIREWIKREPKIKLCVYPWKNPVGNIDWWVDWLNYARDHCPCDWMIQLDGDEVLHEKCYPEVREFISGPRRSGIVTRWNFWHTHKKTIPEGHCCGKKVMRLAPQDVWMPSDGSHIKGAEMGNMSVSTNIEIYHYGFIRKRDAYFAKEKLLHKWFFNTYDPRLVKAEAYRGDWAAMPGLADWFDKCDPFELEHPSIMKGWLNERGYNT